MEEPYRSPIFKEQEKAEALAGVCADILKNSRNELYLSMRFFDSALNALRPVPDFSLNGMGTDGSSLFYDPSFTAALYRRNRIM